MVDIFRSLSATELASLSARALEKHKSFSMEAHLDFLEETATDVINSFTGRNQLQVFPELKITRGISSKTDSKIQRNRAAVSGASNVKKALYSYLKRYPLAHKLNRIVKRLSAQ